MKRVIHSDANILGGTHGFVGTRVPVESLFDYLKRSRTIDYFLEQFPSVQREQVESLLDEGNVTALT
jgi:uncharacterized protein (DUF433 family)